MDALVEKMVEDMRARGVALEIIERSAGQLEAFVAHNGMTPLARRSAADVRSYQVGLLVDERWSWDAVSEVVQALKFFYEVTLGISGVVAELTPLRLRMIDDMRIRNYSPHTMRAHLRRISSLAPTLRSVAGAAMLRRSTDLPHPSRRERMIRRQCGSPARV